MCVGSNNILELRRLERCFKALWIRILLKVCKLSGIDLFERKNGESWQKDLSKVKANARPVKHSIRRYMSKYMSKNRIERSNWRYDQAGNQVHFPSRWWGISASLRAKVKAERREYVSEPMPVAAAHEFFEAVTGELAAVATTVFAYSNVYRPTDTHRVFYNDDLDPHHMWCLTNKHQIRWRLQPQLKREAAKEHAPPVVHRVSSPLCSESSRAIFRFFMNAS